jgi:nicotinamide riboside kinase
MARLIGLSGPQGGGKTTMLNGLKERGIAVDDFKVSRRVQEELGWATLENVLLDPQTMCEFQEKVRDVKYMCERENAARTDVDVILTERTFADIASYAQLWTWELIHEGKWNINHGLQFTTPFVESCANLQTIYDGNIILPVMSHVKWQDDPHRAKENHQDFVARQLEQFFNLRHPRSVPVFHITEPTVEGRVNQTYEWIKSL